MTKVVDDKSSKYCNLKSLMNVDAGINREGSTSKPIYGRAQPEYNASKFWLNIQMCISGTVDNMSNNVNSTTYM